MSELHPLVDRYLEALYELPDELHVRRQLEDTLAAAMTAGHHACIRGFWRAGKTTLMHGALKAACTRTGGAAFFVDLRDPSREDGLPQTAAWVVAHVATRVQEFLTRVGANELKVDPAHPFAVLGELAAPIFVGLDELVALAKLGQEQAGALIDAFLDTPKNVKVAVVCHRHREMDALFEAKVLSRSGLAIAFLPPVTDEELVQIVQTPAQAEGVTFSDEALGVLAQATGNRPWELFVVASVVASQLKPDFKGVIAPEQVEAVLNVDVLADSEEGRALVDNHLRILVAAMTPEERALVELLAKGGEGEVPQDAVQRLEEAGFLSTADGYALNGDLFADTARAVAEGSIKVSVE